MINILITNISTKIGPGDIVGALVNEAGIRPEEIGNIDIDNGMAIVEIAESVSDKVMEQMKDRKIGGEEVDIKIFSDNDREKQKKVKDYIAK